MRQGTDITLCACGIMVGEALKAADILAQQDIRAEVIDCYSLAPFPARPLLSSIQRTGCCVTAEEHFLPGGLFETVPDWRQGSIRYPCSRWRYVPASARAGRLRT